MLELKLTFGSLDDATGVLLRLAGVLDPEGISAPLDVEQAGTAQPSDTATTAETPTRKRRTKAEMEAARAAEAAAVAGTDAAQQPEQATDTAADFLGEEATSRSISDTPGDRKEPEPKPLTKEEAEAKFKNEVRPALGKVMQDKGQDAARKLLNDFGFQKLTDMPAEKYDAFIAVCAKAA